MTETQKAEIEELLVVKSKLTALEKSFNSNLVETRSLQLKLQQKEESEKTLQANMQILESILEDLKYADSHEWAKIEGNSATIGITDHAQDHLGDVVYVELPEVGTAVTQGSGFGAVESVKATSDINSPVSGKVVEVNHELSTSPGLVNGSPYHNGWIMKVEMSNTEEVNSLMDCDQYSKFCEEEDNH